MATLTTRLRKMAASFRDIFASPLGEQYRMAGLPPRHELTLPPVAPMPPAVDPTPREVQTTTANTRFPSIHRDESARTAATKARQLLEQMAAKTQPNVPGLATNFLLLRNLGSKTGPIYGAVREGLVQADGLMTAASIHGSFPGFNNGAPRR